MKTRRTHALKAAPVVDLPLIPLELYPRNCRLQPYSGRLELPPMQIAGDFIAYASPDSTYAVTKRLFDAAKTSILIGIYDFTATYMRDTLKDAAARGVDVRVKLDIDSKEEKTLLRNLSRAGCATVAAPACSSQKAKVFRSSHEKVAVVDNEWVLVQSGNWSRASIPENEADGVLDEDFLTGNRDMGVAVRSAELAALFTSVIEADMKLELDAVEEAALDPVPLPTALTIAEKASRPPDEIFPSLTHQPDEPVRVQPVLSPDNYVDEVKRLLAGARRSIWIENQYIKTHHEAVRELLDAIEDAREANDQLDVRIILARGFDGGKDVAKTFRALARTWGLRSGSNLRILDPKRFDHCHNKLVIVDGRTVLVSSQNWSQSALTENREAGLVIRSSELASYYGRIFQSDWETALRSAPKPRRIEEAFPSVGMVERGDYVEV